MYISYDIAYQRLEILILFSTSKVALTWKFKKKEKKKVEKKNCFLKKKKSYNSYDFS